MDVFLPVLFIIKSKIFADHLVELEIILNISGQVAN